MKKVLVAYVSRTGKTEVETDEGLRACQEYGKAVGQKFGS